MKVYETNENVKHSKDNNKIIQIQSRNWINFLFIDNENEYDNYNQE